MGEKEREGAAERNISGERESGLGGLLSSSPGRGEEGGPGRRRAGARQRAARGEHGGVLPALQEGDGEITKTPSDFSSFSIFCPFPFLDFI